MNKPIKTGAVVALPSPVSAWNEAATRLGATPIPPTRVDPPTQVDQSEDELLLAEAIGDLYARAEQAKHVYNGRELMDFESHPEKIVRLARRLAEGQYREQAAVLADLSARSLRNWMAAAEKGESRFESLARVVSIAEAHAMASAVCDVRAAGRLPQFWAAAMTYLERKNPELWGRRQEAADSPRVVVQIGVKDSDVQVTFASTTSAPTLLDQPLVAAYVPADQEGAAGGATGVEDSGGAIDTPDLARSASGDGRGVHPVRRERTTARRSHSLGNISRLPESVAASSQARRGSRAEAPPAPGHDTDLAGRETGASPQSARASCRKVHDTVKANPAG